MKYFFRQAFVIVLSISCAVNFPSVPGFPSPGFTHSAPLRYKGGDTPQLAVATPRLRQEAFGMYVVTDTVSWARLR